jgi:hypothetical protein
MTSPGAVWHAMVRNGFVIRYMDAGVTIPATRKMQVRGPLALVHARSEPGPESLRLVTSNTWPPRPPRDAAPPPSAPGKAGRAPDATGAVIEMVAVANLLVSATLVAVTVSVPALDGAT